MPGKGQYLEANVNLKQTKVLAAVATVLWIIAIPAFSYWHMSLFSRDHGIPLDATLVMLGMIPAFWHVSIPYVVAMVAIGVAYFAFKAS
jgi:hypothetical protein